jgi:hypothetical protein
VALFRRVRVLERVFVIWRGVSNIILGALRRVRVQKHKKLISKVRDNSGVFGKIIRVDVPTFYYFDENGEFEGMEIMRGDSFSLAYLKPYSRQLAREVLKAVNGEDYLPDKNINRRTPIPEPFKRAFKKGKADGGE